MFRPLLGLGLTLTLAAGCGTTDPDPESADPRLDTLTPAAASQAIRGHEKFGEPEVVEVWGLAASPTAHSLVSSGYLAAPSEAPGRLALTEKARAAGVREDYFQDDVPVFYFPVGTRELLEITSISEAAAGASVVRFTYSRSPNAIGAALLATGAPLERRRADRVLGGKALLVFGDGGWRVSILSLS